MSNFPRWDNDPKRHDDDPIFCTMKPAFSLRSFLIACGGANDVVASKVGESPGKPKRFCGSDRPPNLHCLSRRYGNEGRSSASDDLPPSGELIYPIALQAGCKCLGAMSNRRL